MNQKEIIAGLLSAVDDSFVIVDANGAAAVANGELQEWEQACFVIGIPFGKVVEVFKDIDNHEVRIVQVGSGDVCLVSID